MKKKKKTEQTEDNLKISNSDFPGDNLTEMQEHDEEDLSHMTKCELDKIELMKNSTNLDTEDEKDSTKKEKSKKSKIFGIVISIFHLISIAIFSLVLFDLSLLPLLYLSIIIALNILIWIIIFIIQIKSKKKALISKIIAIILIFSLSIGAYLLFIAGSALTSISGSDEKIDIIKVYVLSSDSSTDIEDVSDYTFGVFSAPGDTTTATTISQIESELGNTINISEYNSFLEQATALNNGEVNAIIINSSYIDVINDSLENFESNIKEVYSYEIVTQLDTNSASSNITEDPFTVLISGIDQYGTIDYTGRSDVNILAIINPVTRDILLVTTPRDTFLEFPDFSYGQKDKLTHSGIYGVDVTMNALANLYQTDVDYFVRLNFTSLINLVDALGGIEVESDQAFTTSQNSGKVFDVEIGTNTLDGEEALAFSRERKNVSGGDYTRGKHQQAVITAMIDKAISPSIIVNANSILDEISGNMETNMSEEEIQSLIQDQLTKGTSFNVTSVDLTGTGGADYTFSIPSTQLSVMYPDERSLEEISMKIKAVKGEDFSIFEAVDITISNRLIEIEEEEEENYY